MKKRTWAIYNKFGDAIDTTEAKSEGDALMQFAKVHHIPDNELDGYWAEEVDA